MDTLYSWKSSTFGHLECPPLEVSIFNVCSFERVYSTVQYLYIFCYIYVKKISGGFMSCEFGEGVNKKFTIHCTEPLAWLMGRSVLYSLYCRVE